MGTLSAVSLTLTIGILYAVYRIIRRLFKNGEISESGSMICPNCGSRGEAKQFTKGSTGIELLLWICFIVPGLIYSLWRLSSRYPGCPSCNQEGMISVNSPNGRLLLKRLGGQS